MINPTPQRHIAAVLFDLDGVLVDAKEWHHEAFNQALQELAPEYVITPDEHLTTYDGIPTHTKLELLARTKGLPVEFFGPLKARKQELTMEVARRSCKPNNELLEALTALLRAGFGLACCSNSVRNTVVTFLMLTGIDHVFDVILSNEDVTNPKPHPEIYLAAAQRLGVSPDRCLVVEDNHYGIEAGKRAGCSVMVVQSSKDVVLSNLVDAMLKVEVEKTWDHPPTTATST